MDPSYYLMAKSLGGDAEKQADAAIEDMAPGVIILFVVVVIGLIIWGIGKLVGAW
jgi:hypothetical protein